MNLKLDDDGGMRSNFPQMSHGYYDERGWWQRTKFCFLPCQRCNCSPPGGLYYSEAHDQSKRDPLKTQLPPETPWIGNYRPDVDYTRKAEDDPNESNLGMP